MYDRKFYIIFRLFVKAGMGNRETEWGECGEWGWECGRIGWEYRECGECGEWGENAGNQGENAGNSGGNAWNRTEIEKNEMKFQFNSLLVLKLKRRTNWLVPWLVGDILRSSFF